MDRSELLLEKARLLILRERELYSLRRQYERRGAWLELARRLSEAVDPRAALSASLDRVVADLVRVLNVQRAACHVVDPTRGIAPFVDERAEPHWVPLDPGAQRLVTEHALGAGALPDTAVVTALGEAVGLALFLWGRVDRGNLPPLLLVAGFDAARADYHAPFEADDIESFGNLSRQLELLLQNRTLLVELESEKRRLAEFNERLEQQVVVRTSELADTLSALRERELRIQQDMTEAQQFQAKILPTELRSQHLEVEWVFDPLERVGGDIFDVAEIAPGRYRVLLADAAGHGVQASMRTMVLKAEYERTKLREPTPAAVLGGLNERLTELFPGGEMLCRGCCLDIEAEAGQVRVTYANAAHPPLLYWTQGRLRELWTIGPFLGVSRGAVWPTPSNFRLGAGDLLLVYSDGLTEQRDGDGRTFEATLKALDLADLPLASGLQLLMTRFERFRGAQPRTDDVTVIALRVR